MSRLCLHMLTKSSIAHDSCEALGWGAGKREEGEGGGSGGHAGVRLLSALLTEMDGMELATGLHSPCRC